MRPKTVGLVAAAEQPEPALAEADGRVELAVERSRSRTSSSSNVRPEPVGLRRLACEPDEVGAVVDADHLVIPRRASASE